MVDEIIFKIQNPRNRLMLELMAWSGMRVGKVLKLRPKDIEDRKAIIQDPKSGRETEAVFLPQKVADRPRNYIRGKEIKPDAGIFPLTYAAARLTVKEAGDLVGVHARPHDLRGHAATYASRSGTPLEIVSKGCCVIRIYQPLKGIWAKSATQRRCGGSIICTGNPTQGRAGVECPPIIGPCIMRV